MATVEGGDGNQTLIGTDGEPNNLFGDFQTMQGIGAIGGDDTLIGGVDSINNLYGDAGSFTGPVTGGDDTLIGGEGGINNLYGDAVTATGGPSSGGDDRLVSAFRTTDNMWGDFDSNTGPTTFGHDTFVFAWKNGDDTIHDFRQGEDIIEIDSTTHKSFADDFSDLKIQEVDTDNNGTSDSSVIDFAGHNSVTVLGVTGLTEADFHFIL